jgi:predicted DNA-binding transcriptional regulator AlpA
MPQTAPDSNDRLVFSDRDLDAHGVLSRKTRWRLRREGRFPLPREIGGRKLYVGAEIRAWLEDPEGWASRHAEGGA